MVLPFIEVSHLPSSSSFFASILQPLGLRYIDSSFSSHQASQSVVFGTPGCPVLEIRQLLSPIKTPRRTHLVFTAPTKSSVTNFSRCGAQANPMASLHRQNYTDSITWPGGTDGIRATVTDMDGNRVDAVYPDPMLLGNAEQHSSTRARKALQRNGEVGRVLEWNGVLIAPSRDTPGPALCGYSRQQSAPRKFTSSQPAQEPPRSSVKSHATPKESRTATNVPESSESSSKVNTSTVIGTFLGIAAGAVLTYGIVSRENQDTVQDGADVPISAPRDTESENRFPLQKNVSTAGHPTRAVTFQHGLQPQKSSSRKSGRRASTSAQESMARQATSRYTALSRRWDLGNITDPSIAPMQHMTISGGQQIAHTSMGGDLYGMPPEDVRLAPTVDRCRDSGHLSSAPQYTAGPPALSAVASRAAQRAPSRVSSAAVDTDRETYVSARSRRSSTASAQVPAHFIPRGAGVESSSSARWMPTYTDRGHLSTVQSLTSARHIPLPESNVGSYTSARHVLLPASGVGSSQADWGDDSDSIVPGDSISCAGYSRRHVTGI